MSDGDDKTPPDEPAEPKSASKKLLVRFLNAFVKEFKPELDELGTRYGSPPLRICKACFNDGKDKPVFYAFSKPGLCDRCEEKISAADSIGLENWELR